MNPKSFKQRVCETIISCATDYKLTFLNYEYLIYSDKFTIKPYYIISAKEGNYKHLTGVSSEKSAYSFFEMCLNGTLTEDDFSFSCKGIVRSKVIALPLMSGLFLQKLTAKEDFVQGKISCSLATSDNKITIGFEDRINAKPKTLLRGNEIKNANPVDVSLILRRSMGFEKFDTLIQGDLKHLNADLSDLITDSMGV